MKDDNLGEATEFSLGVFPPQLRRIMIGGRHVAQQL